MLIPNKNGRIETITGAKIKRLLLRRQRLNLLRNQVPTTRLFLFCSHHKY